ncbi:nuclease-related domain-containing protein [Dietzia sp. 179-F 9C3 NHS]|uniref:nuclease-related domain-containing protein n=1 Tax=Dietzia sp. 179-F 9C3 NHS TaxID=3374295 RepID=UPI00387976B9
MNRTDILDARGDSARGDGAADAGRSLSGILRDRVRYARMDQALKAVAFGSFVAVAVMLVLVVLGHALAAVWVGGIALSAAVTARFLAATQGASAVIASSATAAVATIGAGLTVGASWWETVIALAAIGVTLIPINRRRTRLPVVPVVIAGQWSTVALMLLGKWISVAAPVAALALCIALVYAVGDRASDQRVARAKARSGIQARTMPVDPMAIGTKVPPAMSVRNIEVGIEAEQETASVLSTLGPEYIVLHSRKIPGSAADLDHLVIGPHGVALVDSKFRAGEMSYRELDFGQVDERVLPDGHSARGRTDASGNALPPLQEAAVDAAMETDDAASPDQPDEALPQAALEARQRAYEVFRVAEFSGKPEKVGEWYLNGYPASAALASSTAWEAAQIEKALKMPEGTTIPVLLSIHGARMDREAAAIPLFDSVGVYERDAVVTHSRGIAAAIRELPTVITEQQKIDDLAVVVDDLFPRYS